MAIPSLETNPCGRLAALREIRDALITGGGVTEAEFEAGNGTRRRVRYSAANLAALEREIEFAAQACPTSGVKARRFAIGGRVS